jgi:sec-independent protein translocase protein TatA
MLAFLEGPDLLVVALVVLLVFGGSRLPQLARSLGQAQREFQKAMKPDDGAPADAEPPSADAPDRNE